MELSSSDWAIRAAAFRQIRRLQSISDVLSAADIKAGFEFDGARVPFINQQRGIFKPQKMDALLSIRTVFPRPGNAFWYDDQREIHQQIFRDSEVVDYAFMGTDPNAAENRWLRDAMARQVPIIYFIGVSPGRYLAVVPTFVTSWDPHRLKAQVAFSIPQDTKLPKPAHTHIERRYALRLVQQRLHQAAFRDAVISAYDGRCALSGLPEKLLLDAAHIIPDSESLGDAAVNNGIPLSKIHHAAFDSQLIGIDPDYRIHVSRRLLDQRDGPLLEALKGLHNGHLHLPSRERDKPDRDRLKIRFQEFRALG